MKKHHRKQEINIESSEQQIVEAASSIGARSIPGLNRKSSSSSSSSLSSSDHELEWHHPGWLRNTRKEEHDRIVMFNKRLASKLQVNTLWKFHNFSITHILREINFGVWILEVQNLPF